MSDAPNRGQPGKRPSHDCILLGEDGKFAKHEIENKEGKKMTVNHVVGAAWADDLGENSALIKLEDGTKIKLMSRAKLDAHREAKAKKPPPRSPQPAAKKPARGAAPKSRFSK